MKFLDRLTRALESNKLAAINATPEERAITLDQLFQQLNLYAYSYDGLYFVTIYIDQGLLYALFNSTGELYRAPVVIETDGTVMLGNLETVVQEFAPVSRNRVTVTRQVDGRTRFFMIAGTAIVNRSGQIDSTKLFDNMIKRAEETGVYPKLDFYHLGEVSPLFEFGQFDLLAREGVVYIGSGLLTEGHPLAEAMERAWASEPDQWGASIEFVPDLDSVEYMTVARGIEIAVFNDGFNTRISVLPENDAAAWFTSIPTVEARTAMNDKQKESLKKFFKNDGAFATFMGQVSDINTNVTERGLISRAGAQTESANPTAAETSVEELPALETTFDLDDAAIEAIARSSAMTEIINAAINPIMAQLNGLLEQVRGLSEDVTGLDDAAVQINSQLAELQQTEEEKQRTWRSDLPARRNVTVTHRPREVYADNGTDETLEVRSARSTAKLKSKTSK